jgi:hypothetical protein
MLATNSSGTRTVLRVSVHRPKINVAGTLRVPLLMLSQLLMESADGTRSVPATFRTVNGYVSPVSAWRTLAVVIVVLGTIHAGDGAFVSAAVDNSAEQPAVWIHVDSGHRWRPPFGLDRVGRPLVAVVQIVGDPKPEEYVLVGYQQDKETSRSVLKLSGSSPHVCRVAVDPWPTELVLLAKTASDGGIGGFVVEVARQAVKPVPFEADAVARPDKVIHPIDLGAILPPSDWFLFADGQKGSVEIAAISRKGDVPNAKATVWFESAPTAKMTVGIPLVKDRRVQVRVRLPPVPATVDNDVLYVSITSSDGTERWHKKINSMLVHRPPKLPEFGAVETKLRYDAPILVQGRDGKFSATDYARAWDPKFSDVVVAMPNGSRYVFWRGASYIPFWASRHNTGFCYGWAKRDFGDNTPPEAVDCIEPLMDKELRYNRVRIVESTPARVHIRWQYQMCDFNYRVWGDTPVEDYYFYPDGFGTRVLTLQSEPKAEYNLSEFIGITPQASYPLNVLPPNLVDVLFLDGQKHEIRFPFLRDDADNKAKPRDVAAIYRARMHKDDPMAAIYFSPLQKNLLPTYFKPFFDQGYLVTPTYWGNHWPLARGKGTGWTINDQVQATPGHNSIMSWRCNRPTPVRSGQVETLDAQGRAKPMLTQTWVWLIGMSDANDASLLELARSFCKPPLLEVQGARLDAEPYVPERRAMRLIVEDKSVAITIRSAAGCVNPVFELLEAPKTLVSVRLGGHPLQAKQYAWDGKTLWLNAVVTQDTPLQLEFGAPSFRTQ